MRRRRNTGEQQEQRRREQQRASAKTRPPRLVELHEETAEQRFGELRTRVDRPLDAGEQCSGRIGVVITTSRYARRRLTRPRASRDSTASTLRPSMPATSGTE